MEKPLSCAHPKSDIECVNIMVSGAEQVCEHAKKIWETRMVHSQDEQECYFRYQEWNATMPRIRELAWILRDAIRKGRM